jgi:hypothetical protein
MLARAAGKHGNLVAKKLQALDHKSKAKRNKNALLELGTLPQGARGSR